MTRPACFGVIPARYESSRFPGKPLADILGKPMFQRVYERAASCPELERVVLATDDQRIRAAAEERGVPVVMTRADHKSGTDRVLEAARILGLGDDAVVVNIQGDEPALDPAMLSELLAPFTNSESGGPTAGVNTATLATPLDPEEAKSPDRVKVVVAKDGNALYFSRAPIPYAADGAPGSHLLHIGLYAFRMQALERFSELAPSPLEKREKLEQLRLLENGMDIRVVVTERRCHGVDRPEDIDTVCKLLTEQGQ